jgi:exopolysaccharide production protein ExoY
MKTEWGDGHVDVLFADDVTGLSLLPPVLRRELQDGLDTTPQPSRLSVAGVRLFDITAAATALLMAAPAMAVLALAVKATSPGPVFYGSQRLSGDSRLFRAWRFRSMFVDAEARLEELLAADPALRATYATYSKLPHDPQVTGMGRWIRRLSLDELPQLWNVVKGDMSLVGPRPKLPHEGPIYGELFPVVCRVKPGLTGLRQVSGRSSLSLEQRIVLGVQYVLTRSFRQDLVICLKTAFQMLRPGRGQAH